MLRWDIIAGSSAEVGGTCPEGLAEKTPDQAGWRQCPSWQKEFVCTYMNEQARMEEAWLWPCQALVPKPEKKRAWEHLGEDGRGGEDESCHLTL